MQINKIESSISHRSSNTNPNFTGVKSYVTRQRLTKACQKDFLVETGVVRDVSRMVEGTLKNIARIKNKFGESKLVDINFYIKDQLLHSRVAASDKVIAVEPALRKQAKTIQQTVISQGENLVIETFKTADKLEKYIKETLSNRNF